jgi:tetratricopeptide (TPR) repeat protein
MTIAANATLPGVAGSTRAAAAWLQSMFERDPVVAWMVVIALAACASLWTRPWRVFTRRGRAEIWRRKGIEHTLAGHPEQAQKCFRRALEQSENIPDALRVRLLVCLGDALMDQDRLSEAEDCFSVALQIGDRTGSCQGSIADLLLKEKREPEKALKVADHAYALEAERYREAPVAWKEQYLGLREAVCLARKARAFVLLDQNSDARQAVEKAAGLLKSAKEAHGAQQLDDEQMKRLLFDRRNHSRQKLQFAALHFMIGDAFLALKNKPQAITQFTSGRDDDPKGKYRKLCEQRLAELSPAEQRVAAG